MKTSIFPRSNFICCCSSRKNLLRKRTMMIWITLFALASTMLHFLQNPLRRTLYAETPRTVIRIERDPNHSLLLETAPFVPNIPPIPFILGPKGRASIMLRKMSCAHFPTLFEIAFSNTYWQALRTSDGTFYFYGAYYDDRLGKGQPPYIRILGMMDRIDPAVRTFCEMWFNEETIPVFSRVLSYNLIWNKNWGNYKQGGLQPYMLTCRIPGSRAGKVPVSVSVVEEHCDTARNNLRIFNEKPAKKENFAVCVKGMDYLNEDYSVRLIEWIELLSALGADKIYFYEFSVHPNISKVLRYYQDTGKIGVTPLTLPGDQPNEPVSRHEYLHKQVTHKRKNELIPYNDCFSRNMQRYEYIALLDVDEVIMPMKTMNWSRLMEEVNLNLSRANKPSPTSYCFQNVYFFDNASHHQYQHNLTQGVPKYLHMLQHLYRSKYHNPPLEFVKCFHNTAEVVTLHNHFARTCLHGKCKPHRIPPETAQLQHYRVSCTSGVRNCTNGYKKHYVLDSNILRYKNQIVERVVKVSQDNGFML